MLGQTNVWAWLCHQEILKEQQNPQWAASFVVDYNFECIQEVRDLASSALAFPGISLHSYHSLPLYAALGLNASTSHPFIFVCDGETLQ